MFCFVLFCFVLFYFILNIDIYHCGFSDPFNRLQLFHPNILLHICSYVREEDKEGRIREGEMEKDGKIEGEKSDDIY